VQGMVEGAGH